MAVPLDVSTASERTPDVSATYSRLKLFVFSALTTLLAVGFSFVVLEFGLAVYYMDRQSTNWSQFHPVRGWALVPGHYWVKPLQRLTSFPLDITDLGLRGDNLPARQNKAARILVLGDSFTFAKETRTEKLFTRQLQELLAPRIGGVEVMNAGVPGYGTAQELLLMRELHEQHKLDARVYLLMFFTNDILDNLCLSYGNLAPQPVRPRFTLSEDGQPVLTKLPEKRFDSDDDTLVAARPARGLKTVSIAKALAEEWLQTKPSFVQLLGRLGVKPQVPRMPALLNGWYRDDITVRGVALTRALIRRIQLEAAERGGRLMVAMVPSPFQVYPETYLPMLQKSFADDPLVDRFASDQSRPERLVREICRETGIPFQDLLPVFLKNNDMMLFVPRDGHLNDAGHVLVSHTLADFVVTRWPGSEN